MRFDKTLRRICVSFYDMAVHALPSPFSNNYFTSLDAPLDIKVVFSLAQGPIAQLVRASG